MATRDAAEAMHVRFQNLLHKLGELSVILFMENNQEPTHTAFLLNNMVFCKFTD